MIDGARRGYMEGCHAVVQPIVLDDEAIREKARQTYAKMRSEGYAHLDPEEDFVRSFVNGFRSGLAILNGASWLLSSL